MSERSPNGIPTAATLLFVTVVASLVAGVAVLGGGFVGGDEGERSGAGDRFGSSRVFLVCGDETGSPSDVRGCSIDVTTGSFEEFGNDVRALTRPVFSPDRSLIAYAERRDSQGTVVLRTPDGRADLTLALPSFSGPLDWSSDGSALLVVDRSAVIVIDLDRSRATGTAVFTRFDLPADHDVLGAARFSPAGTEVVVATRSPDPPMLEEVYKVVMIDRSSGERTTLEMVRAPAESARFTGTFSDPVFDPTGRTVAWAEGVTGTLYLHDLTTARTEQHRIAEPASLITGVSWSPTGLLAVGIDARLLIVAIGQDEVELTDPLPDGWSVTAAPPGWSADGSRFVVAVQIPDTAALLDLVLVDLTQVSVRLLTDERVPPLPLTVFPGFPVWEA